MPRTPVADSSATPATMGSIDPPAQVAVAANAN